MLGLKEPVDVRLFATAMVRRVGEPLVSLIRHGGMPTRKRDPIPMLVVLEPMTLDTLAAVGQIINEHKSRVAVETVFFSPSELHNSIDVFPLEFTLMKLSPYQVLHGRDVLQEIQVKPADLRTQLEEDIKTKRLWLRQRFVYSGRNPKLVGALPGEAFPALPPVLRGLLHYKSHPAPEALDALLTAVGEHFDVDAEFLRRLASGQPFTQPQEQILATYLTVLDKLAATIELTD